MEMRKAIGWSLASVWVLVCSAYFVWAPNKITLRQLVLMMPQWCEMTDLTDSKRTITIPPEAALWIILATLIVSNLCWYFSLDKDVVDMEEEVEDKHKAVEARIPKEEETVDVVMKTAQGLAEVIDLEFKHCAATIAANNETPGRMVGGEVEWATGETSSEDEDATRQITGAQIKKCVIPNEDEEILKFLEEPGTVKEPHLKELPKLTSELL